ncbi:ankyrin [Lophium mytilinum]|uniref:Ankyrin n=1 Tax=Lophium mytilinum TaxID=390894 RepID=A0A6A6QK86_9PEZI|nr:ankyrin [Lophium mytilinum]
MTDLRPPPPQQMANPRASPQPFDPLDPRISSEEYRKLYAACDSDEPASLDAFLATLGPRKTLRGLDAGFRHAMSHGKYRLMRHLLSNKSIIIDEAVVQDALSIGSMQLLDFLRESGWDDVNMQVQPGCTPLLLVHSNLPLVSYLLSYGADPNLGPAINAAVGMAGAHQLVPDSGAILSGAVRWGSIECVDLLISHGAILGNASPVHASVEGGSMDMLLHVLGIGGNVDEMDSFAIFGRECCGTPLIRAIKKGELEMVRVLLAKGGSRTIRGYRGCGTPLELVKEEWVLPDIKVIVENY